MLDPHDRWTSPRYKGKYVARNILILSCGSRVLACFFFSLFIITLTPLSCRFNIYSMVIWFFTFFSLSFLRFLLTGFAKSIKKRVSTTPWYKRYYTCITHWRHLMWTCVHLYSSITYTKRFLEPVHLLFFNSLIYICFLKLLFTKFSKRV